MPPVPVEELQAYDGSGKAVYLETCRNNNVIPVSYFLRHMDDSMLDMKHHGLGPDGIKPICVTLVVSQLLIYLLSSILLRDGAKFSLKGPL